MFLNKSKLTKLIKQAYAGLGVKLGIRENGWWFIGGYSWSIECSQTVIPKEIIGEIYKVVGQLPERGECFMANKSDGIQEAIENIYSITGEIRDDRKVIPTMVAIGSSTGTMRVMQDEATGDLHTIKNILLDAIDPKAIEEKAFEGLPEGPFLFTGNSLLWMNDYMKYEVRLADTDDKEVMRLVNQMDGHWLIKREDEPMDQMEMEDEEHHTET